MRLIKYHTMKLYRRVVSFMPGHFTPGVRAPGTDGWAPEPFWTRWRREKSLHCPCCSGGPVRSLVTILTGLPRFLRMQFCISAYEHNSVSTWAFQIP